MTEKLGNCQMNFKLRRSEQREFKYLLCVTFVLCLGVSAVRRLLPRFLRPREAFPHPGESVWAEARRTANTIVPFAFMR